MNVLIVSKDSFFSKGLECYLNRFFDDFKILSNKLITAEEVMQADIIITSTYLNDLLLCNEEMLLRKHNSILICMVERKPLKEDSFWLPNCIKDGILINNNVHPKTVGDIILARTTQKTNKVDICNAKCLHCSYKYLTDTQFLIAYAVKHEFSIDNIASSLDISANTVSTHIERIKKKFMLRNTQDIWRYVTNNHLVPMSPIKPIKMNPLRTEESDL